MSKRMDDNLYKQIKFMFAGGCERKTISDMLCVSYSRVCRVLNTQTLEEYKKKAAPQYRVNNHQYPVLDTLNSLLVRIEELQKWIEDLKKDTEQFYEEYKDSLGDSYFDRRDLE